MLKTCPDCNGEGVVDKDTDDERQCLTCGGRGFVPDDDDDHEELIKTFPMFGKGTSRASISRLIEPGKGPTHLACSVDVVATRFACFGEKLTDVIVGHGGP